MTDLTPKQEAFCLAYVETGNASEAYRRAYNAEKMKPKTVYEASSRLLADSKIAARIAALQAAIAEQTVVSEARIIEEAMRLALIDPAGLFDHDGALLDVADMRPAVRAAVASVEVEELFDGTGRDRRVIGRVKKVKLHDKNASLEKLMRHLGSFLKDNRQKSPLADLPRETMRAVIHRLEGLRVANDTQAANDES